MARLLFRRDLTFSIVALLFAVQAVIRYRSHLNPDVAWYLYAGGRLLDGDVLYKDIVEVNPPLALWLCAAIDAFAEAIGVDVAIIFKTIFFLVTAVALALSAKFIAAATDVTAATRHLFLILVAALMLFLPAADFGQREHAAIILVTPWVLLRWNRLLDLKVAWGLAAIVGAGAAVGLWLKPHFVFVVIAIEVTMAFASRDARAVLRTETLVIIAFGIAYLVAIQLGWSSGTLATIALYGSTAYIPFFGVPFEAVVVQLVLPFALATAAVAGTRLLTEQTSLLRTLLFVTGATFVCAYVLQAGYPYQTIPALHFLALAAGLGLARVLSGEVDLDSRGRRLVAAGAGAAILAVFVSVWSSQYVSYGGRPFEQAIAKEAPDARTVFIASAEVGDSFPLVNENGFVWASRFPSLWLSRYVGRKLDDTGGPDDYIARFMLDANVSDMIAFQPDIVFVDESSDRPDARGAPFDYVVFWKHDPRFRRFWQGYEKRGMVGDFGIYVRTDASQLGSTSSQ